MEPGTCCASGPAAVKNIDIAEMTSVRSCFSAAKSVRLTASGFTWMRYSARPDLMSSTACGATCASAVFAQLQRSRMV